MKKIIFSLINLMFIPSSFAQVYEKNINIENINRKYLVYIPKSFEKEKKATLLFAFHGGGGNADQMLKNYGIKEKADELGFIAIFPNGYSRFPNGMLASWNADACCANARDKKINDVSFVKEILNEVKLKYKIDENKIYATGMSNGGMMTYKLACEMSDTIKAIASVAGTDSTYTCNPKQKISILHIHAKDDDHILYDGGAGPGAFENKNKIYEFNSVSQTVYKWRELNDLSNVRAETILKTNGATCKVYYNEEKYQTKVQLCTTETGGHSWPGVVSQRIKKEPSMSINANDVMWEFFNSLN